MPKGVGYPKGYKKMKKKGKKKKKQAWLLLNGRLCLLKNVASIIIHLVERR